MRKIFLDDLPKGGGSGISSSNINWLKSIGYDVKFIYDNIEGDFTIKNYDKKLRILLIEYDNFLYEIDTRPFLQCKLDKILKKGIFDFKYNIGVILKDDSRDMVITDREIRKKTYIKKNGSESRCNQKWYKYTCNKCGWTEGWIEENNLLRNIGCSCCSSQSRIVVEGINDIPTTNPELIKYFQGGYEEAKLYTKSSGQKIYPICPDCGMIKDKPMTINAIYNQHSIYCSCSDSFKFPEKFMHGILNQLKINFRMQLTKTKFKWCGKYKYDFYFKINRDSYIIETHGNQHYEENTNFQMSLIEQQENDRLKKELALANGIKEENYIVIDCRKSTLEWIRDNDNGILQSRLSELFDLNNINWIKAEEFALSNRVKEVCFIKKENPNLTIKDISNLTKYSTGTIRTWLKHGNKLGWCEYNIIKERQRSAIINNISKKVEIFKDGISLGVFSSCAELERQSEALFGVKLDSGNISKACSGKRKHVKGFGFQYIE